jgi:hypothetical protein
VTAIVTAMTRVIFGAVEMPKRSAPPVHPNVRRGEGMTLLPIVAGTCTTFLQLWSSLGRDLILSPLIDCAQLGLERGRKKAQEEEGEEGQVQVFLEKGRQGQERQEGQEGPQAAAQEATTQLFVRF